MKKHFLSLLVSLLAVSSAAIAQQSTQIEGRVLIETENLKLVELPNHRQAVYYFNDQGVVRLLGQVGKVRAGTEFFHWGNGTPEQAESWDKAGRISPDLLNRLKVDKNFGALGGGFYASLSRVDSMSYGNVQIVLKIPKTMRILLSVPTYGVTGEEWVKIVSQLERLDISALQNRNMPTWFNIVDAEALTKEHVAKTADWKGNFERSSDKTEILTKFPDIYTTPSTKIEIDRYLYHWKSLTSTDQRRIYAAYKYFTSIKDSEGIDFSLALIDPIQNPSFAKDLFASFQAMSPVEKATLLNSANLRSGPLFPEILKLAMRDTSPVIRQAVLQLMMNRTDAEATAYIKANTQDPDENIRRSAYYALYLRTDSEALKLLNQGLSDPNPELRGMIVAMAAAVMKSPEAMAIVRKGMSDPDPRIRVAVLNTLHGRQDQWSLEILKICIRDSNEQVRTAALGVAISRKGMRSLDIVRVVMNGTDNRSKPHAIGMLKDRNDSDSLKILMKALKETDPAIRASAIAALGSRKANFSDIMEAAYKDSDLTVRGAAVNAMTGKTDKRSLDLIARAARNEDLNLRVTAVNALSGRSDQAAVEIFKHAMMDTAKEVRQAAMTAARNVKGQDLIDIVKLGAADPHDWVRYYAFAALQGQTDDFAMEILKTGTADTNMTVRQLAIQKLTQSKVPAAIDYVKDLATNSSDPQTKYIATAILQNAGHVLATATTTATTASAAAQEPKVELTSAQKFEEKFRNLRNKAYENVNAPKCKAVFKN